MSEIVKTKVHGVSLFQANVRHAKDHFEKTGDNRLNLSPQATLPVAVNVESQDGLQLGFLTGVYRGLAARVIQAVAQGDHVAARIVEFKGGSPGKQYVGVRMEVVFRADSD